MIDTHTHLDGFEQRGELDAVLGRARAAGLEGMITIGTGTDDWAIYRRIAARHPGYVWYTVGLHPCSVDERWPEQIAELDEWSDALAAPVALGECGLDRFHLPKSPAAADRVLGWQKAAFGAQLALAKRWGCPVVIHSRGAFAECVAMIEDSGVEWSRVVFHCFVEGVGEMDDLLRRGAYGSFTGIVTYKNAPNVRDALIHAGADRVFFETDAPYLTPEPHRGKPNEPALLKHTLERASSVLNVPIADLVQKSNALARRFFELT